MRQAARIDGNHRDIVYALRKAGASVQSLAAIGRGCPDILLGFRGVNALLEVKDGMKPPSQRKLTADEKEWHAAWRGRVYTVQSITDAITVLEFIANE